MELNLEHLAKVRASPWFEGINWASLWRRQAVEAGECRVFLELVTKPKHETMLLEDEDVLVLEDMLHESEGCEAGQWQGF